MIVAGTGHRPPTLGLSYSWEDKKFLASFALDELRAIPNISKVITGMAQGWDQALAMASIELGIPFIAAVPFEGQQAKWPVYAIDEYEDILARAEKVMVVTPGGYANWKFGRRDRYMVDNCDIVLAIWSGIKSGTGITVEYAKSKKVPIVNAWNNWLKRKELRK